MKFLTALVFAVLVAVVASVTKEHPRGCIYNHGRCLRECEEGTHSYHKGCAHITPEATCDEPNPKEDTSSFICDYSGCYCDPPTVRDRRTKKCVPLEECSKEE